MPISTIIHPWLEVNAVNIFTQYPNMYVKGNKKKSISRQPICFTGSDYDYILEEICRQEKTCFERYVEVYSDE